LSGFGSSITEILNYLAELGYLPFWLAHVGPPDEATAADIHIKVRRKSYVDVLFLPGGRDAP
jgi:hypothetical protein